jgi:hypothetical protein
VAFILWRRGQDSPPPGGAALAAAAVPPPTAPPPTVPPVVAPPADEDLGTLVAPADQPLAPAGDDAATEVHDSPPGPPSQP